MTNKAAYGPGPGPIAFERVGVWKTSPTDQATFGPPLIFPVGTTQWKSTYGVLYKITGVGGGAGGSSSCGFFNGGGGGGGFMLWWVGDGSTQSVTVGTGGAAGSGGVGGNGGTTSFGSISSATGGNGSTCAGGSGTGSGLLMAGSTGVSLGTVPNVAGAPSAFGMGYGGASSGSAGNGTNGTLIIEVVEPMLNSQAQPFTPGYMAP